jgi:oxygen-dependent protoporphyrinogen oxidase
MAQPMVGGIYTADPERLSLRSTFPRFLEMERKHRSLILGLRKQSSDSIAIQGRSPSVKASGPRYSLFLTFDRGMQLLVERLQSKLSRASVQLNSVVKSLDLGPSSQWTIRLQSGTSLSADAVCIALPAYAAGSLLQQTCTELATELAAIPYESTATINLGYKREDIPHPLDGFGFVVPHIEKRTLIACTFSSIKFPGRAPEGHVLLRAFVGGALQPDMFALEEEEISQRVQGELRGLLGIEHKPLLVEVTKWGRSMPQYHVGHLNRVKRIEDQLSRFPTLKLAGNAYTGVGIPDCIRSGEAAAEELCDYLAV